MNENNYITLINKNNLTEQTKFRLREIIGIEKYFYNEINEEKSDIKKLDKYITIFNYINKNFNCFKCYKRWSINYFTYYLGWGVCWNCKC